MNPSKRGGLHLWPKVRSEKPEGKRAYSVSITKALAEEAKIHEPNFSALLERLLVDWLKKAKKSKAPSALS